MVALITGASSDIGKSIAIMLNNNGYDAIPKKWVDQLARKYYSYFIPHEGALWLRFFYIYLDIKVCYTLSRWVGI